MACGVHMAHQQPVLCGGLEGGALTEVCSPFPGCAWPFWCAAEGPAAPRHSEFGQHQFKMILMYNNFFK